MVASGAELGRGRSGEDWSVAGAGVEGTSVTRYWVASVSMSEEGDWWDTSREEEGGLFESAGGDPPRGATGVEAASGAGRWVEMMASKYCSLASKKPTRILRAINSAFESVDGGGGGGGGRA